MRILHTADWHLGKYLNGYPRHNEQVLVMDEICEIADRENVNAIVIAGDLFDTYNPPIESTELFYKTLKKLTGNGKRAVIAIAGNHDSPDRIEAPDPLARECGIIFAGYPNSLVNTFSLDTGLKVLNSDIGFLNISLPGVSYNLRVILTPYANEYRLKTFLGHQNPETELHKVLENTWQNTANKYCDNNGVNILVTHLLLVNKGGQIPDEPDDEKPILHIGGAQAIFTNIIPKQIQYTALGHLHRKQNIDGGLAPAIYPGSPLAYSFSESNQKKYVIIADIEPGKQAKISEIELTSCKKLLQYRAQSVSQAIDWLLQNPNSLIELTMATQTYLTAEQRKQLIAANNGIVSIIPDIENIELINGIQKTNIDLAQSIDKLFAEYFKYTKNQDINDNLMSLFKEVMAENAD